MAKQMIKSEQLVFIALAMMATGVMLKFSFTEADTFDVLIAGGVAAVVALVLVDLWRSRSSAKP